MLLGPVFYCVCALQSTSIGDAEPKRVCILTNLRRNNAATSSLQDQADGDESPESVPFRLGVVGGVGERERAGRRTGEQWGPTDPHPHTCLHTVHQCHFAEPHLLFIPSLFGSPNNRRSRWKLELSGVTSRTEPLLFYTALQTCPIYVTVHDSNLKNVKFFQQNVSSRNAGVDSESDERQRNRISSGRSPHVTVSRS